MTDKQDGLRVVMVTSSLMADIESGDGIDLPDEPTVVLCGPMAAVRAAAQLFGEQVSIAALEPAPDHETWNAAIEAAEGAIKAMRGPIDVPRTGKAVVFDDACESCIDVISTLKKGPPQ